MFRNCCVFQTSERAITAFLGRRHTALAHDGLQPRYSLIDHWLTSADVTPTTFPPDEAERFRTAQALWQQGLVEPARTLLDDILAHHPMHPDATPLLAQLLQSQGQLNAASQLMADWCRHAGLQPAITMRCAQFIQQCQRQALAAALCEESIALGHADAGLHVLAGNLARELGEFELARTHYYTALEGGVDLDNWFVLGALAATRRYTDRADPDFARLIAHFGNSAYSLHARAVTGFGLAKAYDDIADYANAAQTLRGANQLSGQAQPWSREAWAQWLDARMQLRTLETPLPSTSDFVPIFIVGLPRSGTTLAATRLAGHPDVRDRGELPMLGFIAEQLQSGNLMRDAGALRQAAELYRVHAVQDDPRVRWYIDKNPNNFRYLDLIATLFPQARIIHCRRDPRDTALSIWSQSFAHPQYGFASDLDDIADFMRSHDRLMQHWQQRLRVPVHSLDYEAMVADPESTLGTLRAFVDLPTVVAPGTTAISTAAITTASVWQARQPIYNSSVGRWKNYFPYVPELTRF
ncbi:sulfotransferase [Dyella sp. S184]|uniref:tetratricopeptide repeat-containing sulfotransferase family protein n=1 Tax=Dyella sp. S184 TaxID=1641862 RepID=UPI00131E0488|nr:sulfotransferase [Dyella sp. S184]